ncbi:MAG: helix-turn-helix transcriptional regulator [Pseudomonadota bacterium]
MLIAARKNAGHTQAEVAKMLGEHQSFVSRLESGERRVDVIEFIELCDLLRVDASKVIRDLIRVNLED